MSKRFTRKGLLQLAVLALMTMLLGTFLVACGDTATPNATSAPAATTAAMTSAAPAATTAAMTSAMMTSAAAMTSAMMTSAAPAATTASMTSAAAMTSAMMTSSTAMMTSASAMTSAMMTSSTAMMTSASATTSAASTTAATNTVAVQTAAATAAPGAAKLSLPRLRLGAIPAENATKVFDQTRPFADALGKALGVPVDLYVGNNYTAVIEALAAGKIDVAIFGPFSYVLAHDKYNAEAFALETGSDGATSYNSLIITTPKTGIKTLADLKGHSFSFVDPASTSGNLIPRYTLTKAGLNPDKDVQGTFAGGHDASLIGVSSGKTDAGAVASDTFASLTTGTNPKVDPNSVVVINKSDPIPDSPVAYRKELSDSDKAAIKAAFLGLKDPAALKTLGTAGFTDNSDSTYNGLRDVAKILNLDLTKLK